MTYVIVDLCTRDGKCAEVCPVECISDAGDQYVINPTECIDCGACQPECPSDAIFPEDELPDKYASFKEKNAKYFA